jgi:hypothetical protein
MIEQDKNREDKQVELETPEENEDFDPDNAEE